MVIAKSNVMIKFVSGSEQLNEPLVPHPFNTLTVLFAVWLIELFRRDRFTDNSLNLFHKTLALPLKSRIDQLTA